MNKETVERLTSMFSVIAAVKGASYARKVMAIANLAEIEELTMFSVHTVVNMTTDEKEKQELQVKQQQVALYMEMSKVSILSAIIDGMDDAALKDLKADVIAIRKKAHGG